MPVLTICGRSPKQALVRVYEEGDEYQKGSAAHEGDQGDILNGQLPLKA